MQTVSEEEANLESQAASSPTVCEEAGFLLEQSDHETNEENERHKKSRRSSGCDSLVEACFLPESSDDLEEVDWNKILDARWKTMEEVLEKRLHEHFTKYANDIQDRIDVQAENQHKMDHKIEALERSCMDLKRKQGKHHTAFVDLRGMSLMLKDILSGIIRLVDALGDSSDPAAKRNNMSSSEESLGSLLSGENVHLACKELAERVDKMSRQGLWLETRESWQRQIDGKMSRRPTYDMIDKLADAIYKEQEQTSPMKQPAQRESYQLTRIASPESKSPQRFSQISYDSESIRGLSPVGQGQALASLVGSGRAFEVHSPSSSPTLTSYRSTGSTHHTLAPSIPNWARTDIGHQLGQQESIIGSVSGLGLSKSYSTTSGIGLRNSLGGTRGFSPIAGVSKSPSTGSIRVSLSSARCRSTSPSEATHRPIVAGLGTTSRHSYSVQVSSPSKP